MQQPDEVAPSRGNGNDNHEDDTTEKKKEIDEKMQKATDGVEAPVALGVVVVSASSSGTTSSEKTKKESNEKLRKAPGAVVPGAESVSASGTTSLASSGIESAEERAKRKARRADAGESATTNEEEEVTTQPSKARDSLDERTKRKARHADKEGTSVPPRNHDQNDDEEAMVEAVLAVDHTDEIQAARDENEALRRRVEALESGNQGGAVQQGQNDAAIVQAVPADSPSVVGDLDESDRDQEGDPKRQIIVFGSLIIVVIAIVLAVVFGTRSSDPVEVVTDPTTSPVSIPITSTSPTEKLLFEKPTEEECNQVRSGNQVQRQAEMPVRNFDIMVDANVNASVAVVDQALWDELESRIQAVMVPIIVGCTSSNSGRRLRYLASSRYVVANAVTRVMPRDDQSCEFLEQRENVGGICFPVRINLDLYLKGLEYDTTLRIQQLLLAEFQGDVPLVQLLELPSTSPFLSIVATSVISNSPTEAPSTGPTRLPSVVPTIAPSSTPSARPTGTPSSTPTGAPSTVPTISCPENCAGDMNAGNACACADPSRIGCGSCLGWWACTGDLDVKRNSCIGDEACMGVSGGFIGDNSCTGNNACRDLSGAVGDNSCNGPNGGACGGFSGAIGDNSCNGVGACGNSYGFVTKTLTVGNDSCNCEDCCSCLPDNAKVPDNSCNTRDGFRDFFSGGKGPYEVCCPSDPSATGGPSPSPTYDVCGRCCCELFQTTGPCGMCGCTSEVCSELDCSNYPIY